MAISFLIGNIGLMAYQKQRAEKMAPRVGPKTIIQVIGKTFQALFLQHQTISNPIPNAGLTAFDFALQVRASIQQIGMQMQNYLLCSMNVIFFSVISCTMKVRTNVPSISVMIRFIWLTAERVVVIGAWLTSSKYNARNDPATPPAIWQTMYKNPILIGYLYVFLNILKTATAGLQRPPENCLPQEIHMNIEREKSRKKQMIFPRGVVEFPFRLTKFKLPQANSIVPKNQKKMMMKIQRCLLRTIVLALLIQLLIMKYNIKDVNKIIE